MAKSLILGKEFKRRQRYTKIFLNRQVHNSFLKDFKLSIAERQVVKNKLGVYKNSYSIVRLKKYCMLTGHSRSVYRDVNLSRHKFNQMVLNGDIPGFFLGSW